MEKALRKIIEWGEGGATVADLVQIAKDTLAESRKLPYKEIIEYLNLKAETKYRYKSSKTQGLIRARYNEGFGFEDFKKVIATKSDEWLGTEQEKFLRPETLFGNKFEGYLNQKARAKVDYLEARPVSTLPI